jgi:hypothetical protein
MNKIQQLQSTLMVLADPNHYMIHFEKSRDICPNFYFLTHIRPSYDFGGCGSD